MSYGVIVVLFHPTEEQVAKLLRTREHCAELVAVDNSPAPAPVLYDRLRQAGIEVVENHNRGGLAGAYNRGAELLLKQRGRALAFLLDQDSEVGPGFFGDLVAHSAPLDGTPYIVGPRIHETRMDTWMPVRPPLIVPPDLPVVPGLEPCEFVISSGSAISAEAYAKLGPFLEDLFIESVDIEYCLRGWAAGVPTFADHGVVLRQTTGEVSQHGDTYTFNHAPARCYYRARNYTFTLRRHLPRRVARRRALGFAAQQAWLTARFETRKPAKLLATVLGVLDGLFARLGRLEERHPRLARLIAGR